MNFLTGIRSALGIDSPASRASAADFEKGMTFFNIRDYATAAGFFRRAAKQGHASAQYNLGAMYVAGQGVVQDYEPAAYWLQKAAEQGVAQAQYNMGVMYAEGLGVTRNNGQAAYWYQKAAEQGVAPAQSILSQMHGQEPGVKPDIEEAARWYPEAATQEVAPAQMNHPAASSGVSSWSLADTLAASGGELDAKRFKFGFMNEKELVAAQDYEQRLSSFETTATPETAVAQTTFAGVDPSPETTSPDSLAPARDFEEGMKAYSDRDHAAALSFFLRAAERGNANAQFMLAGMYRRGQGVARDNEQAASWFRQAAEQGLADAQFNLGIMYRTGQGVVQDCKQAVSWYQRAAVQEHVKAQFSLGLIFMHQQGQGVAQDCQQAEYWYWKAAEQGDAGAQNNLGAMYEQGQGIAQDYVEAQKWFSLAAANGNEDATANRDITEKKLSPEQIAEAQRRASEWLKAHGK